MLPAIHVEGMLQFSTGWLVGGMQGVGLSVSSDFNYLLLLLVERGCRLNNSVGYSLFVQQNIFLKNKTLLRMLTQFQCLCGVPWIKHLGFGNKHFLVVNWVLYLQEGNKKISLLNIYLMSSKLFLSLVFYTKGNELLNLRIGVVMHNLFFSW